MTTLLVLAGSAVCMRLGIWQLDRLEQRRTFNRQVLDMRSKQGLDLNLGVPDDIQSMEWRTIFVSGEFDFENQVALRNQYFNDVHGYHLITPLLFNGNAVLIDRGWIPAEGNESAEDWKKYDQPGKVHLSGQIRLGHEKPAFGGIEEPQLEPQLTRRELWINLDLKGISGQVPYPMLPIYIQLHVPEEQLAPPIPTQPEIDLSEGPHYGYALQWFAFSAILILGYPFYLQKQA